MTLLVITSLIFLGLAALAIGMVSSKVKNWFKKVFPSRGKKAKLRLLDKGLITAGFYEPIEDPDKVLVIENEYLSQLLTETYESGDLMDYVEIKGLKITNNNQKKISYDWLLASDSHAIGFNIK